MPLSDAQRRVGRKGVAAARDAGHLDHDAAPVNEAVAKRARLISSDLLGQARAILGMTNADIAGRTSLSVSQLNAIDRGRPPVVLHELIAILTDQLTLRVVLEPDTANVARSPVPDDPPPPSTSVDVDEEPAIAIRLPYPDD